MEEGKINNSLDIFERAWASALIKTNSTNFKETGENGDASNITTLYDFVNDPEIARIAGIDSDTRKSDKFRKFYVMRDVYDDNGRGNVNLICDNKGHDVLMLYIEEEGLVIEVPKEIAKNNKAFLGKAAISKDGTKIEIGNLEELNKIMEPDSLNKLLDQIVKYNSPKIRSVEDARNRIKDLPKNEKEKAKVVGKLLETNEEDKSENENELEQIAAEQKFKCSDLSVIVKICKENGLRPEDIKQSLTVAEPSTLIDDIDNSKTNVQENGGAVLVLRFKNKEASAGPDRIYMVQDGKLLPQDQTNDSKVSELLEQHKGNNVQVNNVEDNRVEDVLEEIIEIKLQYDLEKEKIEVGESDKDIESLRNETVSKLYNTIDKYNPPVTEGQEIVNEVTKDIDEGDAEEKNDAEKETEKKEREMPTDDDYFDELGRRKRMR